jgi:sulfur carrier protein
MITIRLNETMCTLEVGHSLHDILLREGHTNPCFAIAVNKQFVPRAEYATTFLKEGDCVEIISPMQGG